MATNYLKSIISVRDKNNTSDISLEILDIKHIAAKYSNTKNPIYKLVINGKEISRNNSYLVKYSCLTCGISQEITLNLFMRKVNTNGTHCISCVNKDKNKSELQSKFMTENAKNIINGLYEKKEPSKLKQLSLPDYLEKSNSDWNMEDDEFMDLYFRIHLTVDEFERIRHLIKGVNNNKLTDLSDWEYYPFYRIYNQTRYTPMLVNRLTNTIEKPYYVSFECECCGELHTHRDIEVIKNKIKIYCKDCSFTNTTFRIRNVTLKDGTKIRWQSIQEKRFIEWCNEHSIKIVNGPKIPYKFMDKDREYRVDFELPDHKLLVEIKDNHCWYKEQVTSGKQNLKEIAAKKWCQENQYTYNLVFPKNIQELKDRLLSCKI